MAYRDDHGRAEKHWLFGLQMMHDGTFLHFRCDGTLIGRLRPQIGTDISLGFGCCVEMMMAFVDAHFSGFG